MRVFEITGKSQAQISNWIQGDKTMTQTKTATQEFIDQLNAAEEVLAALDQCAGTIQGLPRTMLTCFKAVKAQMEYEVAAWNYDLDGNQAIYRCSEAAKPYHTDADGPCDVWSTDNVCSLHIARAEHQMEQAWERTQERADYFRRKNRGEDI